MHEDETRYAQTNIFMHLKKNTASLVVLTLLQMHGNLLLAPASPSWRVNLNTKEDDYGQIKNYRSNMAMGNR